MAEARRPSALVVMGVAGSGKSSLGAALASDLGWLFEDADSFHSPGSVAKMQAGESLNDADRGPWLESLSQLIRDCLERGEGLVLACSALKESYRERLGIDGKRVKLVYLKGGQDEILARLESRQGHFAGPSLLKSQFEILEEPKDALVLDLGPDIEEKILQVERAFFKKG